MMDTKPERLYKYCSVESITDFDKSSEKCTEYGLKNLFNGVQVFSSRTTFNDIFDTRIDLTLPTRSSVKKLRPFIKGPEQKARFKFDIDPNTFDKAMEGISTRINKAWDEYRIYCLTSSNDNNLMWGHYANKHKGICIEFDTIGMSLNKIDYVDETPTFNLLDFFKYNYGLLDKDLYLENIEKIFNLKLREWEKEDEYRIILTNNKKLTSIEKGDYTLVKFDPNWVKSITFGFNMPQETREFIIDNIPYSVKFKEAWRDPKSNGKIIIRDYIR